MTKEEKQLLLVDLSARLSYGVKAQVIGWDEEKGEVEVPLRIYSINTDGYVYFECNDYDVNYLAIDACLLYLRPMSSMTEEEKDEMFGICTLSNCSVHTDWEIVGVEIMSTHPRYGDHYSTDYSVIDWLNKNMFDYRGLIPNGLALQAPEGMYKVEEQV